MRHSNTKHAQAIGIIERTHATLKTSSKISTGKRLSMWHTYIQVAVMNYSTSYQVHPVQHPRHHVWTQTRMEKKHWRRPSGGITKRAKMHQSVKDNLSPSYFKYKRYYDKKATATPLKVNDYCYVLNPKADNHSLKLASKDCIWTGPYVVVKVLSTNNNVVKRTGTRYTQTLPIEFV